MKKQYLILVLLIFNKNIYANDINKIWTMTVESKIVKSWGIKKEELNQYNFNEKYNICIKNNIIVELSKYIDKDSECSSMQYKKTQEKTELTTICNINKNIKTLSNINFSISNKNKKLIGQGSLKTSTVNNDGELFSQFESSIKIQANETNQPCIKK